MIWNILAVLALANLIWLFVFNYSIPDLSFLSSSNGSQPRNNHNAISQKPEEYSLESEESGDQTTESGENGELISEIESNEEPAEGSEVNGQQTVEPEGNGEQTIQNVEVQPVQTETTTQPQAPETGAAAGTAEKTQTEGQTVAAETKTEPHEETVQQEQQPNTPGEKKCRVLEGFYPNIRKGPGLEYDVVGQAAAGTILTLRGERDEGWYPIRKTDGTEGYIYYDMLELLDD